jgi:hypothetical protein
MLDTQLARELHHFWSSREKSVRAEINGATGKLCRDECAADVVCRLDDFNPWNYFVGTR